MKKVTLTVAGVLLTGILFAQSFTPPSAAQTSFKAKYPNGVIDEWYEEEGQITCFFEEEGNFGSAHYTSKGVWIGTDISTEEGQLPATVTTAIKTKYAGYDVTDVTRAENPKQTLYKVYLYHATKDSDLFVTLDATGKVVKEEDLNADDSFE